MSLQHGQPAAFDLSRTDSDKVTLKYGPTIMITDPDFYPRYMSSSAQNTGFGFTQGLRRYIVKYNPSTSQYEHVETQKTCRALYEDHDKINQTQVVNCLHSAHGSGISEPMPSGLLEKLPEVFERPVLGQNMFIDCVTKVLGNEYDANPTGSVAFTIATPFVTRISRFGVLKDGQVAYFKNCIATPAAFWKRVTFDEEYGTDTCGSNISLVTCLVDGNNIKVSQKQCLKMGGT
jgi:hypothetical protein